MGPVLRGAGLDSNQQCLGPSGRGPVFSQVRSQNTGDWELGVLLPTSSPATDLLWGPEKSLSVPQPRFPLP